MPDERPNLLVCCGCGLLHGGWLACPECGCGYVTPARLFKPSQMALFNARELDDQTRHQPLD